MATSTEILVAALTDAGDPKLAPLIERAKTGYYNDFQSPLVSPIMELVKDLRKAGHHDLARRAIDGEFDGTKEESDAWAASPEGQEVFRSLLRGN
ncbi:hypothetical protein [Actinomadura violacea]|uniref:Uncharacterized protein n=1 Tax=Actinomadura violacea TaxID=2819934 RepID=A0ABS3RYL9_9ACTN|nr:hypothetical protein [Actinomadura violacea]MBO2461553.1 hypothetical protein [Actinomadura violacea]